MAPPTRFGYEVIKIAFPKEAGGYHPLIQNQHRIPKSCFQDGVHLYLFAFPLACVGTYTHMLKKPKRLMKYLRDHPFPYVI